jgi:hypothetical protein
MYFKDTWRDMHPTGTFIHRLRWVTSDSTGSSARLRELKGDEPIDHLEIALGQPGKANRHSPSDGERAMSEHLAIQPDPSGVGQIKGDIDPLSHRDRRSEKEHSTEREVGAQPTQGFFAGFDARQNAARNTDVSTPQRVAVPAQTAQGVQANFHRFLQRKESSTPTRRDLPNSRFFDSAFDRDPTRSIAILYAENSARMQLGQ